MLSRFNQFASRVGRHRAGQLLLAGGLLIGLVQGAATAWYVVTSRQAVIGDAVREMRNDALMLAEEQDRLLQAVDVVQLGLIQHMREIGIDSPEQLEQRMTSREVNQNLSDRIAGMAYITTLALADRHGDLLNFSRAWPPPQLNGSALDLFHEMIAPGTSPTFISEPFRSKINGEWIVYFVRRFDAADGSPIGFVMSTIRIGYFEWFYARLQLTGGGAYELYRRDGMLMARNPPIDSSVGTTYAGTTNFRHLLSALDDDVVYEAGIFDGKDRLTVPHAMPHFPMIIAVSDTMDSILGAWREDVSILVATTTLLDLLIAGAVLLAVRHLAAAHRHDAMLAEQDKLAALGRVAGGVAHEINNLLQPALLFPDLMRDRLPPDDVDAHEFLELVLDSMRKARDIVRSVLLFARKQDVNLETVDLAVEIAGSLTFIQNLLPKGISLHQHLGTAGLLAAVNRTQLTQVLTNLVVNAAHATGGRGSIEVELGQARPSARQAAALQLEARAAYLTLAVADTGTGMAASTIAHIFEPFFTTKKPGEGTGLGLSVVFGILRSWRGAIAVNSVVGRGTIFTLYIPIVSQVPAADASAQIAH